MEQRGQQNPKWVVCMFSPADAHIAICDLQRLLGPEATICVAESPRVIPKGLQQGDHHPLLLQARLKDHDGAAKPRLRPEAVLLPVDLELQLAVPPTVYEWLEAFGDLRWGE